MAFQKLATPFGLIGLKEKDGAITRLYRIGPDDPAEPEAPSPLLEEAKRQLSEYLAGRRQRFDLPLAPKGTPFQQAVWKALCDIPYGQTRSYAEIARAVERPKGFRAVGMANNKNPISIIIPCHRVIGSNGALVGYGGGLPMKQALLALEQDGQ